MRTPFPPSSVSTYSLCQHLLWLASLRLVQTFSCAFDLLHAEHRHPTLPLGLFVELQRDRAL